MRIAIIVNGGINAGYNNEGIPSLQSLVKALSKHHEITVFSLSECSGFVEEFRLINNSQPKGLKFLSLTYRFSKNHKREKYDLIQAFFGLNSGFFTVLLGKIFNLPTVVTLMGAESANLEKIGFGALVKKRSRLRIFWALKNATKIIALSKFQCNQLRQNGYSKFDNFEIIPFGISEYGNGNGNGKKTSQPPYRLVSVGNINPVKDHFTLIKSLRVMRNSLDVHCVIVGGDYYKGKIQAFVKEMDLEAHVEFLGQKTNDEVKAEMMKSDLLVISSLSEGQSLVFVEAMSLGIPICSTNVGLMADLNDSHCLTSPIEDEFLLAKNIQTVLTNKEQRRTLILNGLDWVKENSLENIVQKYNRLYGDL